MAAAAPGVDENVAEMAYTAIGVDLAFAAGVRWEPTVDITVRREHLTLEATYMADDG